MEAYDPTAPSLGLTKGPSTPIPTGLDPEYGILYPPIQSTKLSLRGVQPPSTMNDIHYNDYRWHSIRVCEHVQLYLGRKRSPELESTCDECGGQPDAAIRNTYTHLKRFRTMCKRCTGTGKSHFMRSETGSMAEWTLVWTPRKGVEEGEDGDCHTDILKCEDALNALLGEVREDIGKRERRQHDKARMEREMRTLMSYARKGQAKNSRVEKRQTEEPLAKKSQMGCSANG